MFVAVADAGTLDIGQELLEWESGIGQFLPPHGQQFVHSGVALGAPGFTGGHLTGLVGVEALFGHGLVDLLGPLGVDGQGFVRDALDLPVAELARGAGVGLDPVAQFDGLPGRGHPADHGRGVEVLSPEGRVRCLGPTPLVQHLDQVGDEHVVVGPRVPGPRRGVPGVGVDETGGRRGDSGHAPPAAPFSGQLVQVFQGGVPLGVHDGVHVVNLAEDPQLGHRLVGGDDQLIPGRLALTRRWPVLGSHAPPGP